MKLLSKALLLALAVSAGTAQANLKVDDAIKYRQSGYTYMSWNMSRIRANLEGEFKADEVLKAATVIQAIANSGMGALYVPGSNKGTGWEPTRAKAEMFTDGKGVGKVATDFSKAANELAAVSAKGDVAEIKTAFNKLGGTCKACHDNYRAPKKD